MGSGTPLTLHSSHRYLKLLLIVLEGLHDHTHGFHRALEPAIHPVEAVHAARHVYHQAQALGFLLGAAHLREGRQKGLENQKTITGCRSEGLRPAPECRQVGGSPVGCALHKAVPAGGEA